MRSEGRIECKMSTRARAVRLTVHQDGKVVLTVPRHMPREHAVRFAEERAEWIADKVAYFQRRPKRVLPTPSKRDFKQYKDQALVLVRERLHHFNALYGFRWRSVAIRNQRTRWGSTSKSGALSFSYRLALLPARMADYIVVHELCHLKEMNHLRAFWELVERAIPEHRDIRKKLMSGTY